MRPLLRLHQGCIQHQREARGALGALLCVAVCVCPAAVHCLLAASYCALCVCLLAMYLAFEGYAY